MNKHVESRTKIIATLGPASRDKEVLREMIIAGLDIVRINCSHATHEQMAEDIALVRELSRELDRNVAIITDLQGPKIRLGNVPEQGVEVKSGEIVEFTTDENATGEKRLL